MNYLSNETNAYILYPEIDKALQFRLTKIGKVKKHFIEKFISREIISRKILEMSKNIISNM